MGVGAGAGNHTDAVSFESRDGTDLDERELKRTWERFGCHVTSVENLKVEGNSHLIITWQ